MTGQSPGLVMAGGVGWLSLRRPRVANRLSVADLAVLHGQLDEINARPEVRVLVISGEGRHFCAGFDLDAVSTVDAGALFARFTDALESARPITIARLHGGAFGGAADLALACDFRLGTSECRMFVPAARIGLHFYEGGMRRLISRLGLSAAKRVLLAGASLDAAELQRLGFLDELLPDAAALDLRIEALVQDLLTMAPLALLPMKQHLNALAAGRLDAARLAADIERARHSADLAEGAAAWSEGRQAHFKAC